MGTLNCRDSWKSPTRTTFSFFFDGLNSTSSYPINCVGNCVTLVEERIVFLGFRCRHLCRDGAVFVLSPVWYLVKAKLKAWFTCVVTNRNGIIAWELFQSKMILRDSGVRLSKVGNVLEESWFKFRSCRHRWGEQNSCSEELFHLNTFKL